MTMIPDIKTFCKSSGADLVGIADLEPFKHGWTVLPQDLLEPYTRAISIAVHVNDDIINAISDGPTPEYAQHYKSVNASLVKKELKIGLPIYLAFTAVSVILLIVYKLYQWKVL